MEPPADDWPSGTMKANAAMFTAIWCAPSDVTVASR